MTFILLRLSKLENSCLTFHHLGCYGTVGPEYFETERGIWAPRYHTLNTDWQKHRALCPILLSRSLRNVPSVEKRVNLSGWSLWTGPPLLCWFSVSPDCRMGLSTLCPLGFPFFFLQKSWILREDRITFRRFLSSRTVRGSGLTFLSFHAGRSGHSLGTKLFYFLSRGSLELPRFFLRFLATGGFNDSESALVTFTALFSIITSP
jgi:hypothetical protein